MTLTHELKTKGIPSIKYVVEYPVVRRVANKLDDGWMSFVFST